MLIPAKLERAVWVVGAIVGLLGALILVGWVLDVTVIPSGVAGAPRVKANTGFCLLFSGTGLLLVMSRRWTVVARLVAVVVIVVGALSLAESVLMVNLGIDQLLFRDSARLDPGRMAPNTALAFVLCGAALLQVRRARTDRLAEVLAVLGVTIGWLALIGFAAGLSELVQVGTFVKMEFPTAICFLLLGSGLVFAAPGGRLRAMLSSPGPAGPLVRRLLVSVVVVPPVACGVLRLGRAVGVLDEGEVILLIVAAVALSLLTVALSFARSLDRADIGRRQAELELRDSERRHREVVHASIDAFIAIDGSGVITAWNPAAETLFGWRVGEALGRTVAELIVPEHLRSRYQAGLGRLAGGGESAVAGQRVELSGLRRDGQQIPVELSISVTHDTVLGFHAFVHDVSERAAARHAAEVERGRLDNAQAIAHVGSWSWEPATDRMQWSHEMYRIFDRDPAQGPAASEAFFAYLHPDDHDRIAAGYADAFGAGAGFELAFRIVLDHGEVRYLHGIGRREDEGRYVGTVQDITPLRRAQDALIEAERANRTLAMIVQQSNDAVVAKTVPDGVITQWNRAAERIYGYSAAEAVGRPISMLVPAQRAGEDRDIMRELIAGHAIANYETRRVRKDGTVLDVSVTISPILDDDGRIVGASAISRDITERIALQQTLRETEERFRGAFEEAPIGMALLDLDGRLTQVNDALCQILGSTSERLVGMTVASITHPDDLAADRHVYKEIRAGERTSYSTEKRYLHTSGHPVSCTLQATVIAAADGRPSTVLAQLQDITERKRNQEELEYLADHDALTGLLNRRAFARELASHAGLGARYGAEGTVLMIDFDQFKLVNDTLGHQAGDELIVRLAELLSDRLRTSDVLARLGGDEFAVLLPKAGLGAAKLVAQSILDTLRDNAMTVAGTQRKITASIGIAAFEHGADPTGEDALINADLALYEAKEAGRDQVAIFNPERPAAARMKGRITWGQKITAALETDNFTLLAQPIIDFATSTVSQYELLLRMNDEHGELIPPSAFLQIAERLDLIHDIDMWVITHGIQALADLAPERPDISLEINLSGRSLGDQKLLEHIDAELRHTRVAPERIIFEVTETAALTSLTKARAFGEHLSEIGCRFALDDFGGGLGSFYYIKHLVFDYLKIDGEFIRNALSDDTDKLLIKAIVDIARGMGKQTIAEFVSHDETIRLLTRLGVDYGQGYHIGMPAPLQQQLATHATIPPASPVPA